MSHFYAVAVDVDDQFTDTYLFGHYIRKTYKEVLESESVIFLVTHSRALRMCIRNKLPYQFVALSAIATMACEAIAFGHTPSAVLEQCAFYGRPAKMVLYQTIGMPVARMA